MINQYSKSEPRPWPRCAPNCDLPQVRACCAIDHARRIAIRSSEGTAAANPRPLFSCATTSTVLRVHVCRAPKVAIISSSYRAGMISRPGVSCAPTLALPLVVSVVLAVSNRADAASRPFRSCTPSAALPLVASAVTAVPAGAGTINRPVASCTPNLNEPLVVSSRRGCVSRPRSSAVALRLLALDPRLPGRLSGALRTRVQYLPFALHESEPVRSRSSVAAWSLLASNLHLPGRRSGTRRTLSVSEQGGGR